MCDKHWLTVGHQCLRYTYKCLRCDVRHSHTAKLLLRIFVIAELHFLPMNVEILSDIVKQSFCNSGSIENNIYIYI